MLAATPTKQDKLSRSRLLRSSIVPLHAGRISDHACEGCGPTQRIPGRDPENGRHRPACRRDTQTMSRNCEEAIPIVDRS